jgi:hypothetical protein
VTLHRPVLRIFQHAPDDLATQHRIGALRHRLSYRSRNNFVNRGFLRGARINARTLQDALDQFPLTQVQNALIRDQTFGKTAQNLVGRHEHTSAQHSFFSMARIQGPGGRVRVFERQTLAEIFLTEKIKRHLMVGWSGRNTKRRVFP